MITAFAMIAINEFLIQEKIYPKHLLFWLANLFVAYNLFLYIPMNINSKTNTIFITMILFFLITGMIHGIGKKNPVDLFNRYTKLFWGVCYIGFLYPYIIDLSGFGWLGVSGGDWLLFLFAILWVGDSAALFVGKSIGKHKLAPSVSPNKTIEGFIGGLIGAILVGVTIYFWKFNVIAWYHIILIAFGCSIFGQLGDLVESMWKRSINIKDSSNLIPGHGGILDRFDSLLFAAPFMFLYLNFLVQP